MTAADDGLAAIGGHLLRRAHQVHNALWAAEVGREPTSPQYALLRALAAWPGIDQRRAGELASLDRSSTMDVIARLDRRGAISRSRDPADGRRDVLVLGVEAGAVLDALRDPVRRVQERLLAPTSDRDAFLARLAIVARLDADTPADSPQRIPGHLVRRAQQVHTALFSARFDGALTGPQFAVLQALGARRDLSQVALGEAVALDKSTLAELVERLVRRGWLEQTRDPDDGRRRIVALADSGRTALAESTGAVLHVQDELFSPLPRDEVDPFLAELRLIAYPG